MAPSRPPTPPKRPWYLFAALVAGWIYGAQALSEGYEAIAYFRGDHIDFHTLTDDVNDATARDVVLAKIDRWTELRDAGRAREYPLAVASLLLGGAMILFAARSMAGREGARSALVQVVLVHAGLVVARHFLLPATAAAETAWVLAHQEAMVRQSGAPVNAEVLRTLHVAEKIVPVMQLVVQSLASALIVVALTRPRARAFFESVPPQLGEG